ncbi:MAG TPA: nuclear transport factor 2 family protein [Sphingobacteriaceae bacterium]
MKQILSTLTLIAFTTVAFAQGKSFETDAIRKVITTMFDGMRKGDSTMVKSAFAPGVVMQTIVSRDGITRVRTDSAQGFLKAVGTPHTEVWDERVTFDQISVDASLASVWTSYKFYLGDKFSHCGVNSFQLVKLNEGWKIIHLIDTRRKEDCN